MGMAAASAAPRTAVARNATVSGSAGVVAYTISTPGRESRVRVLRARPTPLLAPSELDRAPPPTTHQWTGTAGTGLPYASVVSTTNGTERVPDVAELCESPPNLTRRVSGPGRAVVTKTTGI